MYTSSSRHRGNADRHSCTQYHLHSNQWEDCDDNCRNPPCSCKDQYRDDCYDDCNNYQTHPEFAKVVAVALN
uniref:Uncharacterized protein n=1 Tax=Romanomermis culicivorax TaxID=13658 RepID=A0A915IRG9_ROMCU